MDLYPISRTGPLSPVAGVPQSPVSQPLKGVSDLESRDPTTGYCHDPHSWGSGHDMVRCPDVFDPGNGILDRFVDVSYSWLNRNICTYNHWDNHFYILGFRRRGLLSIPQYTENCTTVFRNCFRRNNQHRDDDLRDKE